MFDLSKKSIILAAGGSGGHLFPAQALAEVLIVRGWTVFLITDQRGLLLAKDFPTEIKRCVLNLRNPWSSGISGFIISLYLMIKSLFVTIKFFRKEKVEIVVGFGGYPSFPAMLVANIFRIPNVIHEQNSILGRVNYIFRNRVSILVFGIKPIKKFKQRVKILFLGNPVRDAFLKQETVVFSDLSTKNFSILVIGGSQGASFISYAVCDAILTLPAQLRNKIKISHQCREVDLAAVKKKYLNCGIEALTKTFFDDIADQMGAADLVISRAGASTLAELCVLGKASILIPLPSAVGNHQAFNATSLEREGGTFVMHQSNLEIKNLSMKISYIIENPKIRNKMALEAKKFGKPRAAEAIADALDNLK